MFRARLSDVGLSFSVFLISSISRISSDIFSVSRNQENWVDDFG